MDVVANTMNMVWRPMIFAVTVREERGNMRTREDARIYKRLHAYDLDDGIGDLLEAMDEELDEELDFEEEDETDSENC